MIIFWELQKIKITYDNINHSVYFKPSAPTILELSKSLDHFKFSPVKKFLFRKSETIFINVQFLAGNTKITKK